MFTLNKVISGIAESLDAIGLGQEQIDLIESSFNREITFAQESVKILEPREGKASREFVDSVYFPVPPNVPPECEFVKSSKLNERCKFRLPMLLPCAYPFPIDDNKNVSLASSCFLGTTNQTLNKLDSRLNMVMNDT